MIYEVLANSTTNLQWLRVFHLVVWFVLVLNLDQGVYRKLGPEMSNHVINERIWTLRNSCSNRENWEKVIVEKVIGPNRDGENWFLHYVLFRFWFTQQFVNLFSCNAEVIYLNIHSYSIHLKTNLCTWHETIMFLIT